MQPFSHCVPPSSPRSSGAAPTLSAIWSPLPSPPPPSPPSRATHFFSQRTPTLVSQSVFYELGRPSFFVPCTNQKMPLSFLPAAHLQPRHVFDTRARCYFYDPCHVVGLGSRVSGIGIDLGEGDDDDDDDLISLETLSTHCSNWRPWRKAALLSSFLRPFCCFPRSAPNGRPVRCVITPDNGGPELNAKF